MTPVAPSAKPVTRGVVRAARAARSPVETDAVARGLADLVDRAVDAALRGGGDHTLDVAVYASLPGEPGTGPLRERLRQAGHRLLLPVLLADRDLDWVVDPGPGAGWSGGAGAAPRWDVLRPPGERLGPAALARCALVLLPALAVDATGTRLGQGGGSYDRALARLGRSPTRPLVLAVVHDDEVLDGAVLPREEHDVPVDGWLTPSTLRLVRG